MPLKRFIQTPPQAPTRDYDVANKKYVDEHIPYTEGGGSGTAGKIVKWVTSEAIGDATNTDSEVASAVSLKHNRKHNIDGTGDHTGVSGAVENNFVAFNANGLPKDSGYKAGDFASVSHNHTASNITDFDTAVESNSKVSTAYSHSQLTSGNPHNVNKTDVGLGNVTNDAQVTLSGNQTIYGVKTFNSFPVTPSSAPASDYEVANKKYVDDNIGGGSGTDEKVKVDSGDTTAGYLEDKIVAGSNITITEQTPTGGSKYLEISASGGSASFGSWASKSVNTVYQASTDGFVVAYNDATAILSGYTDSNNPPTTLRCKNGGEDYPSITMPVKKNDYWKVVKSGERGTTYVYWIPLGT